MCVLISGDLVIINEAKANVCHRMETDVEKSTTFVVVSAGTQTLKVNVGFFSFVY